LDIRISAYSHVLINIIDVEVVLKIYLKSNLVIFLLEELIKWFINCFWKLASATFLFTKFAHVAISFEIEDVNFYSYFVGENLYSFFKGLGYSLAFHTLLLLNLSLFFAFSFPLFLFNGIFNHCLLYLLEIFILNCIRLSDILLIIYKIFSNDFQPEKP